MSIRPLDPNLDDLLQHSSWLKNLARSLVKDPDLADDLVQQTWVTALEHPPRKAGNLKSWLGRVLRNNAYSGHRSDQRRLAREAQTQQPTADQVSHEVVERGETSRLLVEALMRLDEPYRTTLLMRYHEDLTPKEIAHKLGIPAGTVRARLKRGLEKLRADISHSWGKDWSSCSGVLTLFIGKPKPTAVSTSLPLWAASAAVLLSALIYFQPWKAASDGSGTPSFEAAAHLGNGDESKTSLGFAVPNHPDGHARVSARGGGVVAELRASGKKLSANGVLRFGDASGGVQEADVSAGAVAFHSRERDHVLSPRFSAWFIPDNSFALEVFGAQLFDPGDGSEILHLDLGDSADISVSVTDLEGNAISNATLQMGGAYQPEGHEVKTDSMGRWRGKVVGRFPLSFSVAASGFAGSRFKVAEPSSSLQVFEQKHARVMAVVKIVDRRHHMVRNATWGSSRGGSLPRYGANQNIMEQVESRAEIDPIYEYFEWATITEDDWPGMPHTVQREHPSGLVEAQEENFEPKGLLDPTLVPVRFSAPWPLELFPVDVKLTTTEPAVNGKPPSNLVLGWELKSEEGEVTNVRGGSLVSETDSRYRFFLPAGEYSIVSTPPTWIGPFGSSAPKVRQTNNVTVGPIPGEPLVHAVELIEGQFYSEYVFQDEAGTNLVNAWMLVHPDFDVSRKRIRTYSSGARCNFFQVGEEKKILLGSRSGGHLKDTGIKIKLHPTNDGGLIKIRIPHPDLMQFRYPSH